MIAAILILAVGVLLAVLSVVLRKKLDKSWRYSLLATGILVAICGGWFTYGQFVQMREQREAIYLGLRYLERYEEESANYYLKKGGSTDDYETAAARYLLERMRENDLTARLNLDIASSAANSGEKKDFLETLPFVDIRDSGQLAMAVEKLSGFLKLSDKQTSRLDAYLLLETGNSIGYNPDGTQSVEVDQNTADRLQVSALLRNGAYEQAVAVAAELADRKPSEENRLLLAEAVAESAYNGVTLSDTVFTPSGAEEPREDSSIQKERQKLNDQIDKLETKLTEVDIAASSGDEEKIQQKVELIEEIQALQNRANNLYVYRAFSAIADLHSVKADLVRARLHFALQDYEQAVDTLCSTAKSLRAKMTADSDLSNALRIVSQAYDSSTVFQDSQEFRDVAVRLLSAPFSDLMYLSQTPLTQDFTERIISDQKTYGQNLFATHLDTTDYPNIRVTVSGREELLEKIAAQTDVQVRDTRQPVQYTARIEEQAVSNICVVVDRSGSMDGSPMANLKTALESFVRNMNDGTTVSLVAFNDSARPLTELTQDKALLLSEISALSSGGGTNITSGIEAGIESLSPAPGGKIMLLMTDGQSNVDFSVVSEANEKGIVIHTIGFGSVNDSLLEQIAEQTGGQYVKADSSSELSNVYASLQRVIGHVLTLEYTAGNPDIDRQRYFFLTVDGYSVHLDYFLTDAVEQAERVRLDTCSPSLVSTGDLEWATQRGSDLALRLSGEGLEDVSAVTVGGRTAQIEEHREEQLSVTVPPTLTAGWQTVEVTLLDGTTKSFDRLLVVGESISVPQLRLGSLMIDASQGVLLSDGTLALTGGIRMSENVSAGDSTLSLYMNGALSLPVTMEAQALLRSEERPDQIDLGGSGIVSGWGIVALDSRDSAYASDAPEVIARGKLTLECAPEQTKLIQVTEGGD